MAVADAPTTHDPERARAGRALARRLLDEPGLRDRIVRDRVRVIRSLGLDLADIRAAGRHLDGVEHADVGRARVALFHLAVARRSIDDPGGAGPGR